MNQRDFFTKNLTLSTEFDLYVMEHPEVAEQIPQNAIVVLLPEDDQELCAYNIENANKHKKANQEVIFVRIRGLEPPHSRLISPKLEPAPAS